jgi:hypothetical protein
MLTVSDNHIVLGGGGGGGGGGAGDVVGAASSTDNAVVRFDGTTGKLVQNSVVTVADDGAMAIRCGQASGGLVVGADNGGTSVTPSTIKLGRITCPSYSNGLNIMAFSVQSTEDDDFVHLGGTISSAAVAPTTLRFATASIRGVGGSAAVRMTINSAGDVGVGITTPTAKVDVNSDVLRLRTAKTPESSSAVGNQGAICWDASYMYVCVAENTWKRSALTTW